MKAKILKIGTVIPGINNTFNGAILEGWSFDCMNEVVGLEITETGEIFWAGYSYMELLEIYQSVNN